MSLLAYKALARCAAKVLGGAACFDGHLRLSKFFLNVLNDNFAIAQL